MCLIAWNWQPASDTPLLLLANRDEWYARAARGLHWWEDGQILAGQDLQAGGTWLGVSRSGRLAALTNVRAPATARADAPSRGALVPAFLHSALSGADFLQALVPKAQDYNPFNLLVYDGHALLGLHSLHPVVQRVAPGIGGVSNADFGTPWPKLVQLKDRLGHALVQTPDDAQLLGLLHDSSLAHDAALPHTGVPLALERGLSAAFVRLPDYGTRASSLVRLGTRGIAFTEQTFTESGMLGSTQVRFAL